MRWLPLIFLLAACETPPPNLDSVGVLNPTCVAVCIGEYTATSAQGNQGNLSSTKSKTTSTGGAP